MSFRPPSWVLPALGLLALGALLWLETAWPLRRSVEPKGPRLGRNLTLAGISVALFTLLQTPLVLPVAEWTAGHRFGLAQLAPVPAWVRVAIAVVLLDYTLWFWHWANHVVPFLWRFHLVHHVDLDLDTSTALRFHAGEMALSIPVRAVQVLIAGADPLALAVWQGALFVSILFHHSNTRLPLALERVLVRFVVTPRMHGIHHSDRRNETDSNWSSLLSVWDYLHGTIRLDVPQEDVVIGVPAYRAKADVVLSRLLALPFLRQRDDWRDSDGSPAVRTQRRETRARLAA